MYNDFNFFSEFGKKTKSKTDKNNTWAAGSLLVILLIIAIGLTVFNKWYNNQQMAELQKQLDDKTTAYNELLQGEDIALVNDLKSYKLELEKVNSVLNEAFVNKFKIDYRYLLGLNNSLSQNLFLETIHLLESKDGGKSYVTGVSATNNGVADLQNNVRKNKYYDDIFIDNIGSDNNMGYRFTLYFNLIEEDADNEDK
ncbi:MAG: PilN domain-containing protein [Lachnospirales bacterium]